MILLCRGNFIKDLVLFLFDILFVRVGGKMVRGKEQVKQVLAVDTDTLFNDGIFYGLDRKSTRLNSSHAL